MALYATWQYYFCVSTRTDARTGMRTAMRVDLCVDMRHVSLEVTHANGSSADLCCFGTALECRKHSTQAECASSTSQSMSTAKAEEAWSMGRVSKDASHRDLSDATLRSALVLGVCRQHAPKSRQK